MFNKRTTKGLLWDIIAMGNNASHLLNKGKDYEGLLKYLLKWDCYSEKDGSVPSVKEVLDDTGLSYSKLQRQTKLLHKELLYNEGNGIQFNFKEVEYVFSLSYYDNYASFSVKNLLVLPRVGEQVNVPYFENYVGSTIFHVSEIHQEFLDEKQIVYFKLKDGSYDMYWHLRKDEAKCKEELPLIDFFSLSDHELKTKLGITRDIFR